MVLFCFYPILLFTMGALNKYLIIQPSASLNFGPYGWMFR